VCNFTRTLPARGSKLVSNFSTGLAPRQALLSLSLSGSDRIRNMFHRFFRIDETDCNAESPRASDEALDAPTPTLCHTNVETTPSFGCFPEFACSIFE